MALILAIAAAVSEQPHPPAIIRDDFSSGSYRLNDGETSPNGQWYAVSDGGGAIEVIPDKIANSTHSNSVLYEWPQVANSPNETGSALMLSTSKFHNFHLALDVRTKDQLRKNSPPNEWEVAWVVWHWQDNTHFKYFLVKTDGAETGKYDGGVNPVDQKISQTSTYPKAEIGKWMHWDVTVNENHVFVKVNGETVFDFNDTSSYNQGQIGLYCEDSVANFDDVYAEELVSGGA